MLYIYVHILSLAFNANGSLWLINWMRRELEWPVTCEQRSWSDRGWMGKKACVMDRCSEEKEECSDGAGSGERCKYWACDVLPSLTGVITLPYSPSPPGEGLCFNLVARGCISSPLHRLCPYFHPSIHPDCTSNGSSSQQPPAVMELCLNEQLQCPSAAPLFFSVCLIFFPYLLVDAQRLL